MYKSAFYKLPYHGGCEEFFPGFNFAETAGAFRPIEADPILARRLAKGFGCTEPFDVSL
jgi:hypothetical protein